MNPFSYKNDGTQLNLHPVETNGQWTRYSFDFPSAHLSEYQEHNTIHGEYYRPAQGNKFPLAIIVHGMGDRSTLPCRAIARDLARNGIASFILFLIFHSSRLPDSVRKRLPILSAEEWFQSYRTSVIDIRQMLDRAERLNEIDASRLAVIGISLGGFVSAITMGIDSRIQAGIIMLAGGNYESAAWRKLMRIKYNEGELREEQRQYQQYLAELKQKGLENTVPPKQSYLTDPVTFAHLMHNRPLMLINARWDERIPRQTTIDMWEAFGRPPIKWFPGTHSTVWALYPLLRREITGFLGTTFSLEG